MFRNDRIRMLLVALPIAVSPILVGCDSTTAPKFPKPVEEPEDSTPEEGMTGRWSMNPKGLHGGAMPKGVMPFTFSGPETT